MFLPGHCYRLTRSGRDYQSFFGKITHNSLGPAVTKQILWHGFEFIYRGLLGQSVNPSETQNSRMPDVAPGCSPVWLINEDASNHGAELFRHSHTIFECVRLHSCDGRIACPMPLKT
jgi:hypothetical protein